MRAFFSFFLRPFYNFSILFLIADFKNSAETTHVSASEIMKVHHFGQKKEHKPEENRIYARLPRIFDDNYSPFFEKNQAILRIMPPNF